MKTLRRIGLALAGAGLGFIAFEGKFAVDLKKDQKPFEIIDPSSEETSQYPLEVMTVLPNTDNVDDVRQITVTFNKPMVALGDFEKSAQGLPIKIKPEIGCKWRWLNRMTLGCLLDEPLPPANLYFITISKGFKAYDKTQLNSDLVKSFGTTNWKVIRNSLEWKDADKPVFYWTFNQAMNIDSVEKNLKSNCGKPSISKISEEKAEILNVDPTRTYSLSFSKNIGLAKKCKLKLSENASSLSGPEPGKSHTEHFQTYPEFKITKVSCQYQTYSDKPTGNKFKVDQCDPDARVTIGLSAPTYARNMLNKINVKPFFGWSKGGRGSPEYYKQNPDELYHDIVLYGPLNGRDFHTIQLDDIKDQFGRTLKGPKVIEIQTMDFGPHLSVSDNYGVLEKKGPYQVAYDAINLKQFQLSYVKSQSSDDLGLWKLYKNRYDYCRGKKRSRQFPMEQKIIHTNAKLNAPVTKPIDLKEIIPDFNYGLFLGQVKQPKILDQADIDSNELDDFCKSFFLVVTDLGIMAKIGYFDSGVWVHSISTGAPIPGVQIQLRGYSDILAQGVSNQDGFVELAGAVDWDPDRKKYRTWGTEEDLFVVAKTKDDLSILPFYQGTEGISPYSFSNYESEQYFYSQKLSRSSNHIVQAITDRPLYQPGQEVKVKIFARHWKPLTFGLNPAHEVTIFVRDSLGKDIHKAAVTLSEYGTAHTSFKLEPSASLGSYGIVASFKDGWRNRVGFFDVQEFTLPSFKVRVSPIKQHFQAGSSAAFKTSALYHFGGSLAYAKGEYSAFFEEQQWKPTLPKWQTYTFDDQISLNLAGFEKPRTRRNLVLEDGKLQTNGEGNSFTRVLLSPNQIRSYGAVTFESKFKDDKGKTIAGRASARVHYTDFQLGLKKDQWTFKAGEKIEPRVILLDSKENPIEGKKVMVKLVHRKYQTVRLKGAGNYFSYETRTLDKVVDECKSDSSASGKSCTLRAKAAGSHYIYAEAMDSNNRSARSSLHLYVTGSDYVGWYRDNHDRIDIIPDKSSYKLGESISLLVKNPYEEVEGIFTLERFGILKQFRHKLTGGAQIVKIPIDSKNYAPGFYVSVHLIKGRVSEKVEGNIDLGKPSFKMGLAKIKVVNPDTLLTLSAKTNQREYEPGDTVNAEIKVTSPSGKRSSEVSVAVVDEKILQLAGIYKDHFQLHDRFYEIPGVEVMTSQMLSFLIGRRHFGRKGASQGGDGSGLNIRKNFLPLAYWNPSLETDASGKAKFSFKVPDNLTSWRILLVAVDKEHRFGFGEAAFKVNKKLMIEPALPSFLTEGDKLKGRFSVFNKTGQTGAVQGSISLDGLTLEGGKESLEMSVADEGKAYFEWLLGAPFDSRQASLTVKAKHKKTNAVDAALYKFPIRPFVSYEVFADYGSSIKPNASIPINVPKGIREGLGGLEIIYSPSLIAHLDDVFRYAFYYPYGCWEQKLVKALMLNSYRELKEYVSIPEVTQKPDAWISELLSHMKRYQASNGGMGFWKSDLRTVDPYLSVFTAMGMLWLKQNQVPIPESQASLVYSYTKNLLAGKERFPKEYSQKARNTVLAMAAYVRSLLGDPMTSSINRIFQDQERLSLFGKSFLWSAATRDKSSKNVADALKKNIFSTAKLTSGNIQFSEVHDDGYKRILHSTTRTNCQLLVSLLDHDPSGPFIEPLVRWIIGTRKANRWNNTQENLYCLNALSQYAKVYEKETPNFEVSSTALGQSLKTVSFSGFKQNPISNKISFKGAELDHKQGLKVKKSGTGRLYYTTRLKVAYKEVRKDAVNSGMKLQRKYYIKNKSDKWIPQSSTVKIKRGDLVRIELKVSIPATRYHVALADSLPAGLEPLNTSLASTALSEAKGESDDSGGAYAWNEDDRWWGFYINGGFYHREVRLFGTQYFADFLESGDYTLIYIAQAIAVGQFNASPAVAEQMYEPEVYGKSTPAKFIIEE